MLVAANVSKFTACLVDLLLHFAEMQAVFSVLDKHVCTYISSIQNTFPCNYKDFIFLSASVEYSTLVEYDFPLRDYSGGLTTEK